MEELVRGVEAGDPAAGDIIKNSFKGKWAELVHHGVK